MGTITYSAWHCVIYSALKRYKQDYDALYLETIDFISGSSFYVREFQPPLTIEGLCKVINDDKYNISLNSVINTIDWLNELLKIPNFYDILHVEKPNIAFSKEVLDLIDKTKASRNKSFSSLNDDEKSNIRILNRLLLEETYPQETPKSLKESDLYFEDDLFNCSQRLEEAQIVIILLAHSFIEALANFYLLLKTTPDQFNIIEKTGLIDKWTVVPSLFLKDYTFPKGEKIYNDLKELNGRRNAITHCKPQVIIDDEIVLEGNLQIKYKKSHEFMDSCMSLPKRLVDHLGKFDKSADIDLLLSSMADFISNSSEEIATRRYVSEWIKNHKGTNKV